MPIRISPCVRPICCEPVDSTHPDTQGAGADLKLLQKAMGHASITVTANTYADLFDDELDNIAVALDSLDDLQSGGNQLGGPILAP